ncbi:acetylornithine deacetylase [Granulosicoccus sp. 3-233]|uniref:acetylornithine deacetylase n=1 Tax=Granulosicoccus sp. 3-233 TaxID=3417969 RepID=UPI003D3555D3
MSTRDLLKRLIGFDTVSRNPNRELMDFVRTWLAEQGIESLLIPDESGGKANLYATVPGVATDGGIMLSGHTDVVPIDGQDWTLPAFELTERDGRYYGRGTADMKGFVACAMTAMAKARASENPLQVPLHLALSYDEEIGCVGVRSLVEHLSNQSIRPRLCLVGEPTELSVAIRHKGKRGVRATFIGREGHSALAPHNLNAIHLACDFIAHLREVQEQLAAPYGGQEQDKVPYTTVHAGLINGGTALNIVPNRCTVAFEIRNVAEDDPDELLHRIQTHARELVAREQARIPEAAVSFELFNEYPGLATPEDSWAVEFVKSLTGANDCSEVAFGTEAGMFSSRLDIPSVVCGPGSMDQGHKPDEFISIEQMRLCEAMLDRLLARLCNPGGL